MSLYFNRAEVFHQEILALAEQYPQLKYHFFNTAQQKAAFRYRFIRKVSSEF